MLVSDADLPFGVIKLCPIHPGWFMRNTGGRRWMQSTSLESNASLEFWSQHIWGQFIISLNLFDVVSSSSCMWHRIASDNPIFSLQSILDGPICWQDAVEQLMFWAWIGSIGDRRQRITSQVQQLKWLIKNWLNKIEHACTCIDVYCILISGWSHTLWVAVLRLPEIDIVIVVDQVLDEILWCLWIQHCSIWCSLWFSIAYIAGIGKKSWLDKAM